MTKITLHRRFSQAQLRQMIAVADHAGWLSLPERAALRNPKIFESDLIRAVDALRAAEADRSPRASQGTVPLGDLVRAVREASPAWEDRPAQHQSDHGTELAAKLAAAHLGLLVKRPEAEIRIAPEALRAATGPRLKTA